MYNEAPLLRFLAVVPGVVTFLLLLLFVHEEYGQIQSRRRPSVISVYLFGVDPWKFFLLSIFGKVRVSSTNCGLWIHRNSVLRFVVISLNIVSNTYTLRIIYNDIM